MLLLALWLPSSAGSGCSSYRSSLSAAETEKVRLCQRCFSYLERLASADP